MLYLETLKEWPEFDGYQDLARRIIRMSSTAPPLSVFLEKSFSLRGLGR